jgi:plasmid stabilization system protein ParE
MKNGYKIFWTRHAIHELTETLTYLEENWTEKELKNLAIAIEKTVTLIALNPFYFNLLADYPTLEELSYFNLTHFIIK